MAIIINGTNCYDAWFNTSLHITKQPNGDDTNIIVNISNPCDFTNLDTWLRNFNPKKLGRKLDEIRHVINTIFPYNLRSLVSTREDFYKKYSETYSKSRNKRWGTYFQRLISFGKGVAPSYPNQLEFAIKALKSKSPQRFFITFHLTASNIESNVRPLGGPCWQYGELIKNTGDSIDFVVVYRNHDYFNKALGNFIGLAKLLDFICAETGHSPGNLIIHSVHGYSAEGIPKLKKLMNIT